VKLCRFILHETPDQARSGIFHENRVYETDGENAVGIHEITKLAFLPPLKNAVSLRLFGRTAQEPTGFHYANPSEILGPLSQLELPFVQGQGVFANVRLAAIVSDRAEHVDLEEVSKLVLAYTLLINLYSEPNFVDDFQVVVGPFLITPDEFDLSKPRKALIKINGETAIETVEELIDPARYFVAASKGVALQSGDMVAGVPLSISGQVPLTAGIKVGVEVEGLAPLNFSLV